MMYMYKKRLIAFIKSLFGYKTKICSIELSDLVRHGIKTKELNRCYDYSHITNMSDLFACCYKLTSIPLLDTSNVTNMEGMFDFCNNLKTIPLLDTSNVTKMNFMFNGCESLESIPLLDTSKVTNMYGMFRNCTNIESVPFLDTSNVNDMRFMFDDCFNLKDVDPYNYKLYNWSELDNNHIKEKYPEIYI